MKNKDKVLASFSWDGEDDLDDYVQRSTPALYDSFERGAKLGVRFWVAITMCNDLLDLNLTGRKYPVIRVSESTL